jgi:hypothetical protein
VTDIWSLDEFPDAKHAFGKEYRSGILAGCLCSSTVLSSLLNFVEQTCLVIC